MEFKPQIIAFLCKWCSYTGADLAGTSRIEYKPNVRIIRVLCSGRIDPTFVLQAFRQGLMVFYYVVAIGRLPLSGRELQVFKTIFIVAELS
jgi:coenzyme F420-reducing hydrogenase delta subunit